MAVHLGHIHDGTTVDPVADNDKLRGRALRTVRDIAGGDADTAARTLAAVDGRVELAAIVAACRLSRDRAGTVLAEANGNLRSALARAGKP